jgi:hypothetical protein
MFKEIFLEIHSTIYSGLIVIRVYFSKIYSIAAFTWPDCAKM